jgi:hypothetical protein
MSVACAMTPSAVPISATPLPRVPLACSELTVVPLLKKLTGAPNGMAKPSGPPNTVTPLPIPSPPIGELLSYCVVNALALALPLHVTLMAATWL